ncbi:conserved oligomeric Golgi complex subunit 6 [Lingula anatina]|uniref:Conserved oligomeric Golgi complex subunit 6 n=1 Tax=Lingula anatina TaxID=7574 RepID=A0A1S3J901_LINAN|nr:conserved oligomeric Golgi complex subunit 6 [Lingula anatina]|eukprot:XP_013406875.1 conserved oligomeric Golgi complex subunit 6 [Lingula anatina]
MATIQEQTADTSSPSSQPNNPLSRKLNKILDTRLDNDKEMLEALKALSSFFSENTLRNRRNLRGDVERRSLAINEDFIQAFQQVKEQLDSVYEDVKGMSECCQDMTTRLKAAKEQTHDLINQTTQLQTESQRLQMRAQVADAFLAKFQLKPEEVKILRGTRDGALHPDFFKALARVKQIHTDCKVLLRTNQQTAGLEIMESMALHQESAYERLYRWTQNECRALSNESPDISSQLCLGLEALQDRPVLFRYSLDEFGTARRTAIVRGFIDALTRGGPGGTPRPIELHSHDPLRYVGDMLAWLHQATASEKEHLQTLLKKCNNCWKILYGPMYRKKTGIYSGLYGYELIEEAVMKADEANEGTIQDILGHITEGVCRPFKVRVEQVVVAEPGPVLLYKLTNLLKFYEHTIGQLLSKDASLLGTLDEAHVLSSKMFFNSLNIHAARLLDKVELPPAELGPTGPLNQTLQLLKDVLSSHDSSVVSIDDRQKDFSKIMSSVIDPLIQMCSLSASKLTTVDMATYMINCLYTMQSALALFEYTDQRLEMLQAQIDAHIDTLISEQASHILHRVGLASTYGIVQQHQPKQGPLSSIPGMEPGTLKGAIAKFDSFLSTPDGYILQQCSLLQSTTVRETTRKRSMELIVSAYEELYTAITAPQNGYKDPQNLMPRTPEQVKHLLI